jgi:translocation and assembly module TamA
MRVSLSRWLFVALLFVALPAGAMGIELDAPEDIAELLAPHLPEEFAGAGAGQHRLQVLIGEIVATEGYFSPRIDFAEADDAVRITVDPGRRTQVVAVTVTIDGALDADRRNALIAAWPLPAGQPFRQDQWTAAKQEILGRLLGEDFANARLVDSAADIDPLAAEARLNVHYDAGPRYRFGELRVEGLHRFPESLVGRYNRSIEPGQEYSEDRINRLQATLQATPYFRSVLVSIDRSAPPGPDGVVEVPVVVRVTERPAHRLSFGAGFSSNTGARVAFGYQSPDLFGQAWELDSGLRLEQKQQTAYADVLLPPDEKQWRHSVGVMAQASDIEGLRSERVAVGAQRIRLREQLETRLSVTWQDERLYPDGAPGSRAQALVPNVAWSWRKVDNLLDPRDGLVLQAQVGGASAAVLSDRDFVRLLARYQQFIPLGDANILTLRGEAGATLADAREGIPQDYVFRTGGTGSVRGYDYQSLGVKEGEATVGGRYLATASIELTHWLNPEWGIAGFVDAGDAVDQLDDFGLAFGYGLGARWRSPAGPLAVDVAYGERDQRVRVHFALAIAF